MTRYARAKGSKASNERLPNEATPWHVMKQQLEENKNKIPLEKKKSAKELLKDQEDMFNNSSKDNTQEWAEFEDNKSISNTRKHKNSNKNFTRSPEDISYKNNNVSKSQETEDTKIETTDRKTTKSSNKKKKKQGDNTNSVSNEKDSVQELNTPQDSNYVVLSKRQKRNQKRKMEMSNDGSKRFKENTLSKNTNTHQRKEKMKKGEYKRRKPDADVTKIIINGVETEIVMYDRFPVKKEDAERLAELKQKMIMKGIPKSEVDIAMKLERRRAEKALARIRKLVCFNCRKSGHNLSDCPELDNNEATGVCFKCGSTEHTHFECKVNKDSTYRYAKCFICREQGHIAAQCPDNPRGVYPHGGCCKICGAVTHLKKDCPDLVNTKEDNVVTVEKMDDSAIESLQEDTKEKCEGNKPSKNKIIKF